MTHDSTGCLPMQPIVSIGENYDEPASCLHVINSHRLNGPIRS